MNPGMDPQEPAWKADLNKIETALRSDIRNLETDLPSDIKNLERLMIYYMESIQREIKGIHASIARIEAASTRKRYGWTVR
jgi:hypothetical protein